MTAIDWLEQLLAEHDGDLRFETASECAWSGQLRLTLTNPDGAPSRSMTFYSVGASEPEDVAQALLGAVVAWLEESERQPLPIPDWKR